MSNSTDEEVKLLTNILAVALAQLKNNDIRVLKTMEDALNSANRLPKKKPES